MSKINLKMQRKREGKSLESEKNEMTLGAAHQSVIMRGQQSFVRAIREGRGSCGVLPIMTGISGEPAAAGRAGRRPSTS